MAILRNSVNYIELDTDKAILHQDGECTGTLHILGNLSMHVNQPLCFEGATQRRYIKVEQQSGAPGVHYLDIVNEIVMENFGRIRLCMHYA